MARFATAELEECSSVKEGQDFVFFQLLPKIRLEAIKLRAASFGLLFERNFKCTIREVFHHAISSVVFCYWSNCDRFKSHGKIFILT